MTLCSHRCLGLCTALSLTVSSGLTSAQEDNRPLATRWAVDYSGVANVGLAYISDDNFQFGQYNGLSESKAYGVGGFSWIDADANTRWRLDGQNLGLNTRELSGLWSNQALELSFAYDSQQQIRNNSGRTPFRGNEFLTLGEDWIAGTSTPDFGSLSTSLRNTSLEIQREIYRFRVAYQASSALRVESNFAYTDREGRRDRGAAIAGNISAGDAVILPVLIDERNFEVDLGLQFSARNFSLNASLFYNDFDNQINSVSWQNPYSNFGSAVRYPNGLGTLGEEPDTEFLQARLQGSWIISPALRLQVDGSHGRSQQDQRFLPFTSNPLLLPNAATLPRDSLNGEVETGVFNARLFWNPVRKLRLEAYFRGQERDFDLPRDGYQYVMADEYVIPGAAGRLFNSGYSHSSNTYGLEGSYPLPFRSKLWLSYEFEDLERENSAVQAAKEDRYEVRFRVPLGAAFNLRFETQFADRNADSYEWDQSYYARLDSERINATPDSQRFLNHPLLSQYHIATREQLQSKLDLSWQPAVDWNLMLNLLHRENDYDKTELGLGSEELGSIGLNATWSVSKGLVLSAWASASVFESRQNGRAFRGGLEKNAFAIYPPLPQASDPARNWQVDSEDQSSNLGFSIEWQPSKVLTLSADYSYQDTESDYVFANGGAADLSSESFPDRYNTTMHHAQAEATWQVQEHLAWSFDYQYWDYASDDWALVSESSIEKVLTLGLQAPNESLHYIGMSIVYRWQ